MRLVRWCFIWAKNTGPSASTLFYPGHALHSFLSETKYQNVSGTRGSLDFGEVPSSFFELFLRHEEGLSAVARHYRTGEVGVSFRQE